MVSEVAEVIDLEHIVVGGAKRGRHPEMRVCLAISLTTARSRSHRSLFGSRSLFSG